MIYALPSASFEAAADGFASGLVGTLGVRILDNTGGTTLARTTSGISEIVTGVYAVTLTAPGSAGQYSIVWDDTSLFASEDLTVTTAASQQVVTAPAPGGGGYTMSYADLRAAIYERRFPTSSPVAQWLAAAYADVWNAAPWTFKRISRATFYTTTDGTAGGAASATPLMPAAFGRSLALYDHNGDELDELPPHESERTFTPITGTGVPEAYAVVNRQIILGPAPDSAYAFKLSYRRRLATRTNAGAVQEGFFVADSDIPLWDDHHYLLVLRAKLIGLRDRSDPTAADLEGEFGRLLEAMKEEYAEKVRGVWSPAWP